MEVQPTYGELGQRSNTFVSLWIRRANPFGLSH